MKILLIASAVVFAVSQSTVAQSPMQPPPSGDYPAHMFPEEFFDRNETNRRETSLRREARVLKKGPLAPSVNDRTAFRVLLRDLDTGLFRLLPREVYYRELYKSKKAPDIRGGGAYYSFSNRTHVHGYGSDIQLEVNNLSVGFAGTDYGMLTNLGDIGLGEIAFQDPRIAFMANYQPPRREPEAQSEALRFRAGVQLNGALYQSRLPVVANSTYLLRSIVYRSSHGSDVLVAFRVVRKDDDGGVVIAWKRLRKYRAPKLPRPNRISYPQTRIIKWPTR